MKKILLLLAATLALACSKEKGAEEPGLNLAAKGVFICNEGNFMAGNASMSFYDPEAKTVQNQIFYQANDTPLGDVVQSMSIRGDKGYLVINNSGKIYVVNTKTFRHQGTITGLTSPRYMLFLSDTKAYVSDLYSTSMSVVNPQTYQVTGSIEIGSHKLMMPDLGGNLVETDEACGTEKMVRYGDYVFVTSWSYNNKVYRIDTRTDQLIDFVEVTKQPNSIVLDKNNKLWVLSDGGYAGSPYGQETAAITRIDAATFTKEQTYVFPSTDYSPSKLCINAAGDKLYYICNNWASANMEGCGIYAMDVDAAALPAVPVIPQGSQQQFYALDLNLDPVSSEIYVSDAIDYSQPGWVMRYGMDGTLIDKFKADISPGAFCFKDAATD